jgi:hypothetical protein
MVPPQLVKAIVTCTSPILRALDRNDGDKIALAA